MGNRLIDFTKGIFGKSKPQSNWWNGLDEQTQEYYSSTVDFFNKKAKKKNFDINNYPEFADLSDDVKSYFKNVEAGKASTEGLNKAMSSTMRTASSTGTEFVSTGSKIKDFGKQVATTAKGFGNVLKNGLKTVGSAALGIGANVVINAGIGLAINGLIDLWDKYANAQENAIDRGNEAITKAQENQQKIANAQDLLDNIQSDMVVDATTGQTITRFEQLSQGVNSLGENVSLTQSEFAEYTSLLDQMSSAGLTTTNSLSNLEDQVKNLRKSTNMDTLEGLSDWVDSFNAQNNQDVTDFTKEPGFQQNIKALEKIQDIASGQISSSEGKKTSFWEKLGLTAYGNEMITQAGQSLSTKQAEALREEGEKALEDLLNDKTFERAAKELADKYSLDIFDKKGNIDASKLSSSEMKQQISDALEQEQTVLENTVKQSSGFLEALFQNDSVYDELPETITSKISGIFSQIDYDTISQNMMDSNGMLNEGVMRDWVSGLADSLDNKTVQDQLEQLFSLDTHKSEMTFKEYESQANNLIDSITKAVPQLSEETLRASSGFEDSFDDLEKAYNRVSKLFGTENANKLSNQNLELAMDVIAEDNFSGTFDELLKQIHQVKQEALDLEANPIFDSIAAADESKNAGADYEQAYQYAQQAKEMYDQGLIGTDDFKTRAAYLSPTESDDPANFIENYSKAVRYLTEDKAGVNNFLSDLQKKGMATFTTLSDGTKDWSFNLGDLDEASHKLGIGFEFMMDMFGRMNDYGINNNFFSSIEDGQTHLQELSQSLAEEEARLAELTSPGQYQTTDGKTLGNQTAIDASRKKIELLKNDIVETSELLTQVAERSNQQWESDYNAALTTVQSLSEARKRILADPELSEGAKGYAASQIETQIKDLANQYGIELDANLNIDTSEIDAIQNKTIQIKGNVDLSEGRTASTEAIQGAGWEASEGTTSVYKSYNSDDQTHSMVITPVLPDGTVLTPEQTQEYVNQLFAGQKIEPDIKVATFVGEDAATQAQNYTESINSINAAVATGSEEIQGYLNDLKQFNASELEGIDFADGQLSKGEESLENFMNAVGISTDKSSEFIAVLRDMGYIGMNSAQEIIQSVEGINFDTVKEQVSAANDTLLALGATDIHFDISTEDLDSIEEQITNAKSLVESFQNSSGQVDLSIDGAQESLQILSALIDRKQALSEPAVMSVDTSNLSDVQSSIISVVQQWQSAYDEVQKLQQMSDVGVNVDVELGDAQSQLDSLTQQLQSLSDNSETAELMASIKLDPSSADPETIASQIGEIPIDVKGNIVGWEDNSTAEDKDANVNYKKGEQDPPDDKDANVNYKKGEQDPPEDKNASVNYKIGEQDPPTTKNAKANYTVGDSPESVPDANGTANFKLGDSPEKVPNANGEADFSLGDSPSIVPDASGVANYTLGDYPTSLPPITQTVYVNRVESEVSKATGTMISPAKASGTAYNVLNTIPAHASGNVALPRDEKALVNEFGPQAPESIVRDNRWFIIPGGPQLASLKKGDIIFNAQQTAQLLKAGKTSAPGKAFAEGTMPHVRNLVSTSLNAYADGSDDTLESIDWVERLFNKFEKEISHITSVLDRQAHLPYRISEAYNALGKNKEYIQATQSAMNTYQSQLDSIGLSADIIDKIKNGSLEISKYDEETRNLISEYQEYYDKLQDCSAQYDDLIAQQTEFAQTVLDNISDYYDMMNGVDEAAMGWLEARRELYENQGKNATYGNQRASIQDSMNQQQKVTDRLQKQVNDFAAEIENLISNGYMARYSKEYFEAHETLNGFKEELYESQSALIEFEDQLRELDYTAIQNKIDGFAQAVDKISAQINLMEARDEKVPESVYQQQIDANNNQIAANQQLRASKLKEQGLYDVGSTRYQELAEEINDLDVETLNLMADNEALKDSIYELRFADLDNQIEAYGKLKDEINDFRSLLNKDAFFAKNGGLTEEGLAELALIQQGIAASKNEIADYREGLEKLKKSYENGVISLDEYNEKSEEYCAGIRDSIKDVSDYEDALTDLYMTQMRAENEALQEVIDKRKEALQAKKSYYDYDKTLKSQTKSINMLRAEIAALQGVRKFARLLFYCGKIPITLFRYNVTGNGKRECGTCF